MSYQNLPMQVRGYIQASANTAPQSGVELCWKMGDAICEGGVSWRVLKPARTSRRNDTP